MPSTPGSPVRSVHAVVTAWLDHVGPGLYGVACSGGADSIALADAVIAIAGASNVVVMTIDHGLAPGSAALAEAVGAWARDRGAAAVARRVTVERRASVEAAARDARYAALDALADELGITTIFVAHTARDQAETVLLRVVRGTGPAGLAGIPAERGRIARPFLALERAVIEAYVAQRALPTWNDPMNADHTFARVRLRETILPMLRRENHNLDAALVRLAASTLEWLAAIDGVAAPLAKLPIECAALAPHPAAIRKRAVAIVLDRLGLDYEAVHLDAVDRLVTAAPRGQVSIDVPGARVVRTYGTLDVVRAPPTDTVAPVTVRHAPAGYLLRPWQPGDRMRPQRLHGRSRKLGDLFIDAKVPRNLRATAVVMIRASDGTIVWAEHIGLAVDIAPDLVPT